jgi:hypothetical protein
MAARNRKLVEWVGGVFSLPAYITGEGGPYRPETLVWMGASGVVLGHRVEKPGQALRVAAESLRHTIIRPMVGDPHAPDSVRVASRALASALQASLPDIEIVCAPTPELDDLAASMRADMNPSEDRIETYITPEVGPEANASLFSAAAALFRAEPWKTVPSDECLFSVTIESLGLVDAALCVVGQMGENHGIVLFSSLEDFETFRDAARELMDGGEPILPLHLSLNCEGSADLGAGRKREVAEHGWELAGPDAYPVLVVVEGAFEMRSPTAKEVTIFEATARAVPRILEDTDAVLAAWAGGKPFSRTLSVPTRTGDLEIAFHAPHVEETPGVGPNAGVLGQLHALALDGTELDAEARVPLEDALVEQFAASPEAATLRDTDTCRFVMDSAADYFRATIATLGPSAFEKIVFEIIPRKMYVDPSEASEIVEELRALYAFLKREFGLKQADACLRVLGDDAVKKLEVALADRTRFGMAKMFVTQGRDAGFAVDTKEGLEAWMRFAQASGVLGHLGPRSTGSAARPTKGNAQRAKKDQRKAQRAARKRNR